MKRISFKDSKGLKLTQMVLTGRKIMTRRSTRLYFGSEFYPYFALNEIRLLLSELKGIAGIIEEVMIKTTPEE